MSDTSKTVAEGIDEYEIRQWFKTVDIEQARDTFRVVEGVLEMRGSQRKRRRDAGKPRGPQEPDQHEQDRKLFESNLE